MELEKVLQTLGIKGTALPIAGGDVNSAFRVKDKGDYLLKIHPQVKKEFFQAEAEGLKALDPVLRVPKVYQVGEIPEGAFLLMEWTTPGSGDQREAAAAVALLHQQVGEEFGFKKDNYLGSLPQINQKSTDWLEFFLTNRLDVQVKLAQANNHWQGKRAENYQRLKEQIKKDWRGLDFVPSLLHGDLWSGNFFFDQNGRPIFIDPAVSYGHREMDIAMTQLFGGFRPEFLATYQEVCPLEEGWQNRLPIYQLYYLLAHLNMFGESYGQAVDRILAL